MRIKEHGQRGESRSLAGSPGRGSAARGAALGWMGSRVRRVLGEGADPGQRVLRGCDSGMEPGRVAVGLGGESGRRGVEAGVRGDGETKGVRGADGAEGYGPGGRGGAHREARAKGQQVGPAPGPGAGRRGVRWGRGTCRGGAVSEPVLPEPRGHRPRHQQHPRHHRHRRRRRRSCRGPRPHVTRARAGGRSRCVARPWRPDVWGGPSARARRLPWRPDKRWAANDSGASGRRGRKAELPDPAGGGRDPAEPGVRCIRRKHAPRGLGARGGRAGGAGLRAGAGRRGVGGRPRGRGPAGPQGRCRPPARGSRGGRWADPAPPLPLPAGGNGSHDSRSAHTSRAALPPPAVRAPPPLCAAKTPRPAGVPQGSRSLLQRRPPPAVHGRTDPAGESGPERGPFPARPSPRGHTHRWSVFNVSLHCYHPVRAKVQGQDVLAESAVPGPVPDPPWSGNEELVVPGSLGDSSPVSRTHFSLCSHFEALKEIV